MMFPGAGEERGRGIEHSSGPLCLGLKTTMCTLDLCQCAL